MGIHAGLLPLVYLLVTNFFDSPHSWGAIPSILHQVSTLPSRCARSELEEVVPGKFLTKPLADIISKLRRMNPDWQYRLWDYHSISAFLHVHSTELNHLLNLQPGEDIKDIYNSINPHYGAARSDFFRYVVLYMQGGVYLDLKGFCHLPFDQLLLPTDRLVVVDWDPVCCRSWGHAGKEIPGRNEEHLNGFIAVEPRHPAMRAVVLRVLGRYRRYQTTCLELQECPRKLLYRYKDDSSFDKSSECPWPGGAVCQASCATRWPRRRHHCFGRVGTIVLTGPVVFTTALMAAQTPDAVPDLGIRVIQANTSRDFVYDFRVLDDPNRVHMERKKLYCTNNTYHTLKEPIYLPLRISLGIWYGNITIPPGPAKSLACPASPTRPPTVTVERLRRLLRDGP